MDGQQNKTQVKKSRLSIIAFLAAVTVVLLVFLNSSTASRRPQEPAKPYSYYSEEVAFPNQKANVMLAGTLTLPEKEGSYPAVVLITGGGPQNRDGEFSGHKPFLVISDYLTKNGIAVLRYDDRGVGQSSGDFETATTLDFASDAESALSYLKTRKEIRANAIGLVGHSEGGIIAPMVASTSKEVSFIVLLAGPGIKGDRAISMQQELIERALGVAASDIAKSKKTNAEIASIMARHKDGDALKADLTRYAAENFSSIPTHLKPAEMTKEQYIAAHIDRLSSPWDHFLWNYDPTPTLEKVTCPVLALNGEKDLQVPPEENLSAIGDALEKGGNKDVTIKELANLNHFFQECESGSPAEYATIEQTFSPTALAEISDWILEQVK